MEMHYSWLFRCILNVLLLSSPLLLLSPLSYAYPNEAGSCTQGVPVMGIHLESQLTTGELFEGNFQVLLNDNLVLVPNQPFDVLLGNISTISIVTTNANIPFRGFLIRIETDEVDALSSVDFDDQVQIASSCSVIGVPGITHLSNADKTQIIGSLVLQKVSRDLSMDVTVVVEADESVSKFYHSTFSLSVTDNSSGTTLSPSSFSPAVPAALGSSTGAPNTEIPGGDTSIPITATAPNTEIPGVDSSAPISIAPNTESPLLGSSSIAPNSAIPGGESSSPITLIPDTMSPSIGNVPITSPPSSESQASGPGESTESPSISLPIPTTISLSPETSSRPSKEIPPIFFSDDRPSRKFRRRENTYYEASHGTPWI